MTVLTLTVAVLLGGGPILAVQATVSAVYVAVVAAPENTLGFSRFTDALVGGAVALVVNQLPLHRSPVRVLVNDAGEVFDRLSGVLLAVADALAGHDEPAAEQALQAARGTDAEVARFRDAVDVAVDAARLDPLQRRRRQPLFRRYEQVAQQMDYAVRNTRVLARNVVVLTRSEAPPPPTLPEAIRELARAVQALGVDVAASAVVGADEPQGAAEPQSAVDPQGVDEPQSAGKPQSAGEPHSVVEHALAAVRGASAALSPGASLPVIGTVWQVRSTAVDLLRGTGMELQTVLELTDEALS